MPQKLDSFEFKSPRPTSSMYPLDQLLNGEIWKCCPGEDFKCEPHSFAQTMYSAAKRLGKKTRVRTQSDGCVIIQAYEPEVAVAAEEVTPATPQEVPSYVPSTSSLENVVA